MHLLIVVLCFYRSIKDNEFVLRLRISHKPEKPEINKFYVSLIEFYVFLSLKSDGNIFQDFLFVSGEFKGIIFFLLDVACLRVANKSDNFASSNAVMSPYSRSSQLRLLYISYKSVRSFYRSFLRNCHNDIMCALKLRSNDLYDLRFYSKIALSEAKPIRFERCWNWRTDFSFIRRREMKLLSV